MEKIMANAPKSIAGTEFKPREREKFDPKIERLQNLSGPTFIEKNQKDESKEDKRKANLYDLMQSGIPITSIVQEEGRRRKLSDTAYAELKTNIFENGLIHKIVVRATENGTFEIVAGHNRFQIFKELRNEYPADERFFKIPADIQKIESKEAEEKAFYSNLIQSELSDYEKYLGLKSLMNKFGDTQEALSKKTGIARSTLTVILAYDRLPSEVIEILNKKNSLFQARSASDLSKLGEKNKASLIAAVSGLYVGIYKNVKEAIEKETEKLFKKEALTPQKIKVETTVRKIQNVDKVTLVSVKRRLNVLTVVFEEAAQMNESQLKEFHKEIEVLLKKKIVTE